MKFKKTKRYAFKPPPTKMGAKEKMINVPTVGQTMEHTDTS